MKRLFYFLLFLPALAAAGSKSKPISLNGLWKETARTDLRDNPIPFTDTIRISFLTGNEYTWRQAGSFIFRGTYTATEKEIDLGMRQFRILSRTGDRLVLGDDTRRYTLLRYTEKPQQEDNSSATTGDRLKHTEGYKGVQDVKQLTGKWTVYKRTSGVKLEEVNYQRIIRNISIGGEEEESGRLGSVWAAKDPLEAPSWEIDRFDHSTLYCSGKDARELKVLKCADGELILQEGNITYFFKQF